jgi:hypothetical protein
VRAVTSGGRIYAILGVMTDSPANTDTQGKVLSMRRNIVIREGKRSTSAGRFDWWEQAKTAISLLAINEYAWHACAECQPPALRCVRVQTNWPNDGDGDSVVVHLGRVLAGQLVAERSNHGRDLGDLGRKILDLGAD